MSAGSASGDRDDSGYVGRLLLPVAAACLVAAAWLAFRPFHLGRGRESCGSPVQVGLHHERGFDTAARVRLQRGNPAATASSGRSQFHVDCWAQARGRLFDGGALVALAVVLVGLWVLWRRVGSPRSAATERRRFGLAASDLAGLWKAGPVVYGACFGAVLVLVGIATRSVRAGEEWHFITSPFSPPILFGALLIAAVLVLRSAAIRLLSSGVSVVVVLAAVAGSVVQSLIFGFGLEPLDQWMRASDYRSVASKYNSRYLLRHYLDLAKHLPLHQKANMPGKVIFFRVLLRLTHSDVVLASIFLVVSAIGGVLLYSLGRRLRLSRRAALNAMFLYFFVPAKIIYLPSMNNVTPVLGIALLLLLLLYRDTRRISLLAVLGLVLYVTTLFEPSPLFLLPVGLALVAGPGIAGRLAGRELVPLLLVPAAVFLGIYSVMRIGLHFDIFGALLHVARDGRQFNQYFRARYTDWPGPNLREFFVNAGYASSLVFLGTIAALLVRAAHSVPRPQERTAHQPAASGLAIHTTDIKTLAVGLTLEVLVLDLLGMSRGEVSRLWLFIAALIPLVIADVTSGPSGSRLYHIVLISSVAQAVLTMRMVGFDYLIIFDVAATRPMLHQWTWTIDTFTVLFLGYVCATTIRSGKWTEQAPLRHPGRRPSE